MHDHLLCSCINISNVLDHRFMHHIMHCCLFLACFFYKFCFVLIFVDLTFLVLFFSVFKKIQKPIKIEKSSKSLIACVVYITWEFSLVPSYLWHSAFTSLTCFVCTYIFVGEILKTMGDCCK